MELKLRNKLAKESNSEYAYRILHSNIMTLQLPPGSILNEGELSQILSVSRTPVHEAILKLRSENLVNVYPQSASKVSLINIEFIKEGLFLRSNIEPAIIKKISGLISSQELLPLKQNLEQQQQSIHSEDPINTFFKVDDDFHHIIYDLANKQNTWYSVKSVCSHYDRARYMDAILNKTGLNEIYNEHKKIYHYILMGISQENDFNQFYQNHLNTFDKGLDNVIQHYSSYFLL